MKKIYYTFLLLIISQLSFGQSLNLVRKGVNINKTSITVTGNSDEEELEIQDIEVINTSSSPKDIRVKRYEISYVPDTYNFICWGVCEAPFNHKGGKNPFYILNTTVNITSSYAGFSGHYLPQGTKGTSEYRYVFYDIKNPVDSSWFNVVYSTSLSSDNEIQAENDFKFYPNPAHDKIFIESKIDLQPTDIQVFNRFGERQNVVLKNNFIETDTFQNGFYFIKIKIGEQEIVKRFLVLH
jgi:hypothetical protein